MLLYVPALIPPQLRNEAKSPLTGGFKFLVYCNLQFCIKFAGKKEKAAYLFYAQSRISRVLRYKGWVYNFLMSYEGEDDLDAEEVSSNIEDAFDDLEGEDTDLDGVLI